MNTAHEWLKEFLGEYDEVQVSEQQIEHGGIFEHELETRGRRFGQDMGEYLHFTLGPEHYAIELNQIKEIIKASEITPVPRTPDYVAGIISLRGEIIPIYRLNQILSLIRADDITSRLVLVVEGRNRAVAGLMVSRIINVVRVSNKAIEPPPATLAESGREFVIGIGRIDGLMLIMLDLDTVIGGSADGDHH